MRHAAAASGPSKGTNDANVRNVDTYAAGGPNPLEGRRSTWNHWSNVRATATQPRWGSTWTSASAAAPTVRGVTVGRRRPRADADDATHWPTNVHRTASKAVAGTTVTRVPRGPGWNDTSTSSFWYGHAVVRTRTAHAAATDSSGATTSTVPGYGPVTHRTNRGTLACDR